MLILLNRCTRYQWYRSIDFFDKLLFKNVYIIIRCVFYFPANNYVIKKRKINRLF